MEAGVCCLLCNKSLNIKDMKDIEKYGWHRILIKDLSTAKQDDINEDKIEILEVYGFLCPECYLKLFLKI